MMKNCPYTVPEGYFEELQTRLSEIPNVPECKVSGWQKFQPYLALAACFLFALIIGNLLFKKTDGQPVASDDMYEMLIYADIIPHSEPNSIFDITEATSLQDNQTETDIISYLIDSGTSIELIDYLSE